MTSGARTHNLAVFEVSSILMSTYSTSSPHLSIGLLRSLTFSYACKNCVIPSLLTLSRCGSESFQVKGLPAVNNPIAFNPSSQKKKETHLLKTRQEDPVGHTPQNHDHPNRLPLTPHRSSSRSPRLTHLLPKKSRILLLHTHTPLHINLTESLFPTMPVVPAKQIKDC